MILASDTRPQPTAPPPPRFVSEITEITAEAADSF
jgi:hypothetical protein